MKAKYKDESYKTLGYSNIHEDPDGALTGSAKTPLGIVEIFCWPFNEKYPKMAEYTQLAFIWKGRTHYRIFKKAFTKKGLARLSFRFAREVAAGKVKP